MGATINAINPATLNPGTTSEANQKHKPLIINENAPKLRIFKGRDSIDNTGFRPEFTIPMLTAANRAAGKLAIFTPEKIISTTKRLKVVAKIVKNELNIVYLLLNFFES